MSKKLPLILSFFLIAAFVLVAVPSLQAQVQTPSQTVFQKEDIEADIEEVGRTYRGQLAEYRQHEQQFIVAQQQFFNLNTLSSLESAVQATQKVLFSRSQVLETYVLLQKLEVMNAQGINIKYRDEVVLRLDALQKALRRHKEAAQQTNDRLGVNKLSDDFVVLAEDLRINSSMADQLLRLGRLQTIYDKAVSLGADLNDLAATSSGNLQNNAYQRAVDQVGSSLLQTQDLLIETNEEVDEALIDNDTANLRRDLSDIYNLLSRTLSFLEEIIKFEL